MKSKLYFIEFSNENFSEYEKYAEFLTSDKKARIQNFRFNADKKLSLFSDLFVRYITCKELGLGNSDLSFTKNSFGKPYLADFPNFQYNISHTKNAILIGVSEKPIGVDIEKIKNSDLKIAERFFCKKELEHIISSDGYDQAFYEIWTKKEAYIKWIGKGLSLPLNSFDITSPEINRMLNIFKVNDYILAVCGEEFFCKLELEILDEHQMTQILSGFFNHSV